LSGLLVSSVKIDLLLALTKGFDHGRRIKRRIGKVASTAGNPPEAVRVDLGLSTIS
jgi:hypothetical protein